MSRKHLSGGLFDGRGKPQPLKVRKSSQQTITPEKSIQMSFVAWRDMFEGRFPVLRAIFAVPNGVWAQNTAVAMSQLRQGLTPGIQDIICLAPSADGKYHGLLIEFKTEVGKQSPEQLFFHNFFAELGYRTEVCRSAWRASQIVNEHLNLNVPVYPR